MKVLKIGVTFIFLQLQLLGQPTRLLNGDSLVKDFKILKTSLVENHPLFLQYISLSEFESFSQTLEKQILRGQTLAHFHSSLSEFVRIIGCGHTYVYPSSFSEERLKYTNDLPFTISVIQDSIYIRNGYAGLDQKYTGASILSINKKPSIDLLKFFYRVSSTDGFNLNYKRHLLQNKFDYYLSVFLNYPDSLVFETSRGELKIGFPTNYKKPTEVDSPPSFKNLEDKDKTVLLSIPNFDGEESVIKKCFDYCSKNQTKYLIIDLRNNGGGNGNIASLLLSYLIDTTHIYYLDKKVAPFKHKKYLEKGAGIIISNQFVMKDSVTKSYYFKVKPQKKNAFKGNVYVLINSGTFSSAAYVASVLRFKTKAIFIGEETGGSQYAIGGGVINKLTLPYSNLSVKFPLFKWDFNTTSKAGQGVLPDHKSSNKVYDILNNNNNNDLELRKAQELIKKNK